MNLFYLDEDIDKCAEYHMDTHVNKMITEATQMLTTAIWVDKFIGFVPQKLNKEQLGILNEEKAKQPSIEERNFTRFLPAHPNHPASIWVRSSIDNYEWTFNYVDALNREYVFRYRKPFNHNSFEAAIRLPEPSNLSAQGITQRPLCMPEDYKFEGSVIDCYRMYYMIEKSDWAVWKRRFKPPWWNEDLVQYLGRDPHQAYLNTVNAPTNKGKPHSRDYEHVHC